MATEKRVMISRARRDLFDLFEEVVAHGRKRVRIGHRDSKAEAVLISKAELDGLEARARAAESASPFCLVGSATITGAAEDVLAGTRAQQTALRETKEQALGGKPSR